MMTVLDTHALVWWATKNKRLTKAARREIERSKRRGVAAISLWEVAHLIGRGKLRIDVDSESWLEELLACDRVELLPLTAAIAARSCALGAFHGDPADRLIVATALVHGARLVTADTAIHDSRVVESVW